MNPVSVSLVIAQFALIALIVSPISALFDAPASSLSGLVLIGFSILLALWAMASMRLANFSVLPEPVISGKLVTSGPYRYIRHPMYSAVIFSCLGAAISHRDTISWVCLLALCAVLLLKIRREELLLRIRYREYKQYSQQTRAIIPWVY